MNLPYALTELNVINDPLLDKRNVRLLVKREDQNHPFVSGNKWWKLKYNLEEAARQNKKTLLTFGGAYSNHIYAVAAAAYETGLRSIGMIRGEETLPLNPTLSFAKEHGMELHYVARSEYRHKGTDEFIQQLTNRFGDFYCIPEGGTNALAVKGCQEFATSLNDITFDVLCLAVGTGGTMAGLLNGLQQKRVLGFSSLKGGDFLKDEVNALTHHRWNDYPWEIITDYHFGGYGKTNPALYSFIDSFEKQHNIPLDQVYTGKMMYGVFDLISKGYFREGTTILVLHTGGLQGRNKGTFYS
jgi:1-aminocyclopropane-1-carboxylate deaminase